ncbi:MAG: c-type cytochrome [Gemmatimonadota bacterium]|nr:c-type cytochrome [Gemmatimonadota bacterium]
MRRRHWAIFACIILTAACDRRGSVPIQLVEGGSAERGNARIESAGCGSCHVIPGVRGADGVVGPNLTAFGRHSFIGGEAPNTPDALVRWIMDPHQIEPATVMPDLEINERDARDIAAYLYTLR